MMLSRIALRASRGGALRPPLGRHAARRTMQNRSGDRDPIAAAFGDEIGPILNVAARPVAAAFAAGEGAEPGGDEGAMMRLALEAPRAAPVTTGATMPPRQDSSSDSKQQQPSICSETHCCLPCGLGACLAKSC